VIYTTDFRDKLCPEDAALVLVDPPFCIGKRYASGIEQGHYEDWVKDILMWSKAPWTLILGPHTTMYDWLPRIPRPTRIMYWHRTFVGPRGGLKTWTESLTPILVYQKDNAVWHGKTGNQRDQHDCIDSHSSMADSGRLKRLGLRGDWPKHPAITGTQFSSKVIPLVTALGDLVVDPMCGVGSILVAAQRLGRRTWGSEIEEGYAKAAREWLAAEKELGT
jgi:hypothetical protein